MRKENYKEEVNFTQEQIKIDRKRDPAIDYSYEDKGSIFRKISKSRAEKKMHKDGHIGYSDRDNYDLEDYYDSRDYYNSDDYDDYVDSNYSSNDYNNTSDKENNEIFDKAKSWVERNASKESKDLFNNLKNEYKNIQNNIGDNKKKESSKSNRKSKSGGYKTCKNCGAQMYSDAKVCPKCGEDQKTKNGVGFIISKIIKLIIIIVIINRIIGVFSYIFTSDIDLSFEEEPTPEESYIEYDEYKKPVKLKYIANQKDVIKTDKEKCTVGNGKDIPAGEYIFVKNEGSSLGSIEVISEADQENSELYETAKRNYYVKLDEGDTVKLYNGTLYKADQVELDMTDENNKKSGMYRIGKDVGDTFTIEGNSRTYYAIFDADNIIIDNGFLDEGNITIDSAFIEEKTMQGETAKYIFVSDGIIK